MAGPVTTVAAEVGRSLQGIRGHTHEIAPLAAGIVGTLAEIDRLRRTVDGLKGNASRELVQAMSTKLTAVRRAADAIKQHAKSRRSYKPHEYLISLSELAEYLDGKLDDAIDYFHEVERRNPAALRRSEHGRVISVPIERGNDSSSRFAG